MSPVETATLLLLSRIALFNKVGNCMQIFIRRTKSILSKKEACTLMPGNGPSWAEKFRSLDSLVPLSESGQRAPLHRHRVPRRRAPRLALYLRYVLHPRTRVTTAIS